VACAVRDLRLEVRTECLLTSGLSLGGPVCCLGLRLNGYGRIGGCKDYKSMTLPVDGFCNNCRHEPAASSGDSGRYGRGGLQLRLAQAVSRTGQLGVVSSVALDTILSRRLQDGDPGGDMRRGLAMFPDQAMANRILDKHFNPMDAPRAKATSCCLCWRALIPRGHRARRSRQLCGGGAGTRWPPEPGWHQPDGEDSASLPALAI